MTGEDITVTFKTSDAAEILAGAGVVFEALQDLAEAESSITINGQTFELDEELSISALANAILGDDGVEGFLEDKTLTVTYTANVVVEDGSFELEGSLTFILDVEEEPVDPKPAFIAAFNDIIDDIQVEGKTVANAAMTGEDITVTFKTSDAAEILAGAGVVFEALQDLAEAESSITINGQTFELDEELSISALANAILGDDGVEGFLEDKTLTVTYTANVVVEDGSFELEGSLTFILDVEEEPVDPKPAFIAAFNDIIDDIQVEGKTVANAAMTGEDITVTFKTSDAAEILAGAGVVFEALQDLAEAESSITINGQTFELDEELSISALANAILGDDGVEGFLEDKTLTVTYTANVVVEDGSFELEGSLTFILDVEEEPVDPKPAFIAAFNDIIDDIQVEGKTVANAAMTGEDITVTFKTSDAAEILAGAGVVFEALQDLAEAESSITINGQTFELDEELSISALANAILGDDGVEGFLEDKTLTVTYTANVVVEDGSFELEGSLTFILDVEEEPVDPKPAFIAAFNDIIDDIQVEGKTVANAAMTGEDITVTFKTSDAAEILAGAGVVFEALQDLAEAESSITINGQTFELDEELSISALANAILGDDGVEGFLEDKTLTVTYTANVVVEDGSFELEGSLTFILDVEEEPVDPKPAFIAAFNDIIDDIQVEGKTVANAAMTGEDITVTFKTSDAAEILAGAGVVFEALQDLAEAESSITINGQTFELDEELSISALANAILGDDGVEGFLEDKTLTVTYTANVVVEDGSFELEGSLTFILDVEEEPVDPKPAFIAAFNDIIDDIQVEGKTVANAAMTGEDITVTFKTSDAAEILAGAGVVFEALQDLAEAESSITINGQTFELDEELSISALANAILGDDGVEGFLEDKTLTVTYTANVVVEDGSFELTGNLDLQLRC
jgi:predicted RNA-binding protein Jag